jgi:hypothetical protein
LDSSHPDRIGSDGSLGSDDGSLGFLVVNLGCNGIITLKTLKHGNEMEQQLL